MEDIIGIKLSSMEDSLSFYTMSHESLVFTTITIHPYLFLKKNQCYDNYKSKIQTIKN